MAQELQDDGSFSVSGAFVEVSLIDPTPGGFATRKLFEATGITWTEDRASTPVQLANNESGSKSGAVTRSGSIDVRYIDETFYELAGRSIDLGDLEARRAARDAGTRNRTDVTLQVHIDDPEALGPIAFELTGVKFRSRTGGGSLSEPVIGRAYAFDLRKVRRLEGFTILGEQVNEVTGLPIVTRLAAGNA